MCGFVRVLPVNRRWAFTNTPNNQLMDLRLRMTDTGVGKGFAAPRHLVQRSQHLVPVGHHLAQHRAAQVGAARVPS